MKGEILGSHEVEGNSSRATIPTNLTRRRLVFDTTHAIGGAAVVAIFARDIFKSSDRNHRIANTTFPNKVPEEEILAAKEQTTKYEKEALLSGRSGDLTQLPQRFNGQRLQKAYTVVDENALIDKQRGALVSQLTAEPLPVIGMSRFFVTFTAGIVGTLYLFNGVTNIIVKGLEAVQNKFIPSGEIQLRRPKAPQVSNNTPPANL